MNNGIFGFPATRFGSLAQTVPLLNTRTAIRVDEYATAGTYTRQTAPGGANYLTILLYGGGGGGQGGAAQLAGTVPAGGGGGGGGGTAFVSYSLRDLPTSITQYGPFVLRVTVGAGGGGGAARNTTGGGNGGSSGGNSAVYFTTGNDSTILMNAAFVNGGNAGSGSSGQRNGTGGKGMLMGATSEYVANLTGGVRGQDGGGTPSWSSGGFRFPRQWSNTQNWDIPNHPYICGGGGCGGVVNTDGTSQQAGGAGGYGYFYANDYRAADGGTGTGADATLGDIIFAGVGGNGGYSATVAQAINAYNGGAGIRGGGGGGGGGLVISASPNTYSSGAGGAGGAGYCLLIWTP